LGVLHNTGKHGLLLGRCLHRHKAMKVFKIVFRADPVWSVCAAGGPGGGHAASTATTMLRVHSAGNDEQSDSDNQYRSPGHGHGRTTLDRSATKPSSGLEHTQDLQMFS
jgi:hypothetical protein